MKIALIVGTRPNIIKAAPLWRVLQGRAEVRLIHTGQHRDAAMSAVFFQELGLPAPDVVLARDAGSPVRETAQIALELEPVLQEFQPDWVVVIGDVTSTLAGALAAKQSGFRLAHVEAGLRSDDRRMPEELNRIAVDHLSDLLFATETAAVENLRREGIPDARIHFVGNVLIDALSAVLPEAEKMIFRAETQRLGALENALRLCVSALKKNYALCTFHRPANVDDRAGLELMLDLLFRVSGHLPVIFPAHPRTVQKMREFDLEKRLRDCPNIQLLPPLAYSEMVCLMLHARVVITDSGGVQEETTWLGVPCLTFRENTERPVTVEMGTNVLISDLNPESAERQIELLLAGNFKPGAIPPLWEGKAAGRIADVLCAFPNKPLPTSEKPCAQGMSNSSLIAHHSSLHNV
ncbi:MAG: UDP-N-acetylglucosamine 2-epimerase (non-hydrolyzing) [Saprospiraceae bacterium]|jgi:UDP-N-acetylglucosamine 2-epimerase (non-hydrolysing)|nr:UDP-N-acetylglucosamine 2-epimerase (non-hydrolyzing) [Saprospiraceae bacterium]